MVMVMIRDVESRLGVRSSSFEDDVGTCMVGVAQTRRLGNGKG